MAYRIEEVEQIKNESTDEFVKSRANELIGFINRLIQIDLSVKKMQCSKFDFCVVYDLVLLYKDVCYELNKLFQSDTLFEDSIYNNINCQIPQNPYIFQLSLPQAGNYDGNITNENENDIQNLYKLYYKHNVVNKIGIINHIGILFNKLIGNNNLNILLDYFECKKTKLEELFRKKNIKQCNVTELILFYKEICKHLLKLRDEFDEKEYDAGKPCNIPEKDSGIVIFDFLTQDFLNGQQGGEEIDGNFLQCLLEKHYNNIYEKVVNPVCNIFDKIVKNIKCEKEKLIPYDINEILPQDSTCVCSSTEICEFCKNKKFIKIKKLFGTEQEILNLLNHIRCKITEIHEFYKEEYLLPAKLTQADYNSYIQEKYGNTTSPEIIPNPNGIGAIAILTVLDPTDSTNQYFKMEDKIKNSDETGLYDELNKCNKELLDFLELIENCRKDINTSIDKKNEKTEIIKSELDKMYNRFRDGSNCDLFVDIQSSVVDINLLKSYTRYLKCLTVLRCKMREHIDEINKLLDCIDEENEDFKDILTGSEYYKCVYSARWMLYEDRKHKKNR
jgi:hypothetical protein